MITIHQYRLFFNESYDEHFNSEFNQPRLNEPTLVIVRW